MKPNMKRNKQGPCASTERDAEAGLTNLHILIVEDMGLVAHELRLMLDKMGCHIVGVASRLSEAVKLAKATERLDGVLLDLNLSGQNSYPVAEILHERGIPFIIMSGYDVSHVRADCANDAHLLKPFGHDDLEKTMQCAFLPGKEV